MARTYQLKDQPEGLSGLAALDLSLYMILKLFAPFLPHITEEIWSWRFQNESRSIHTSEWIGLESWPRREAGSLKTSGKTSSAGGGAFGPAASAAGADSLDFAFFVLERIRAQKSAKQKSLAAPGRSLLVRGAAEYSPLLDLAKKDLSRAGHIPEAQIRFEEGGPPSAEAQSQPGIFAEVLLELE